MSDDRTETDAERIERINADVLAVRNTQPAHDRFGMMLHFWTAHLPWLIARVAALQEQNVGLANILKQWPMDTYRQAAENPGEAFENRRVLAREIVKRLGVPGMKKIAEKAAVEAYAVPCGEAVVQGIIAEYQRLVTDAERMIPAIREVLPALPDGTYCQCQGEHDCGYCNAKNFLARISSPPKEPHA